MCRAEERARERERRDDIFLNYKPLQKLCELTYEMSIKVLSNKVERTLLKVTGSDAATKGSSNQKNSGSIPS